MILVIRKDVSFAVHNVLIGAVDTTTFMEKIMRNLTTVIKYVSTDVCTINHTALATT
jgi:hypothetical protein